MMRTYLMKFMLQQSESRFFGFFILICFCGCFLLDVLLPLLLLLLLLWWLFVPFLVDLFGAIALLVFLTLGFYSTIFLLSRLTQVAHCECVFALFHSLSEHHMAENQIFNSLSFLLQLNRFRVFSFFLSDFAVELIAFCLCQHWTLIIAVFRLFVAFWPFHPSACARTQKST